MSVPWLPMKPVNLRRRVGLLAKEDHLVNVEKKVFDCMVIVPLDAGEKAGHRDKLSFVGDGSDLALLASPPPHVSLALDTILEVFDDISDHLSRLVASNREFFGDEVVKQALSLIYGDVIKICLQIISTIPRDSQRLSGLGRVGRLFLAVARSMDRIIGSGLLPDVAVSQLTCQSSATQSNSAKSGLQLWGGGGEASPEGPAN
ncbi:hypothetical protein C8J57DRAFT_1238812 [Mycena rebaudengoi]|nr:hypothetical protein C8J57DRAFT_1238812 [Mycena rebaudengoi]